MASDYIKLPAAGGGGAVDSVNGETGAVVLDADDVGAANQALDNLSATAINASLEPDAGGTLDLGGFGNNHWRDVDANAHFSRNAGGTRVSSIYGLAITSPSGATVEGAFVQDPSSSTPLSIHTWSRALDATQDLLLETGNALADSGSILVISGTSEDENTGGISIVSGTATANIADKKSGTISIGSGASTGALNGGSGALALSTGSSVSTVDASGSISIGTGESAYQSGDIVMSTGAGTVADDGYSGAIIIASGLVTGSALSGSLTLSTGGSDSGATGDINLVVGTTGGANSGSINLEISDGPDADGTGTINLRAYRTQLLQGVIKLYNSAADPADLSAYEAGDFYYNSASNKLKFFNGTIWETVTSA